MRIDNMPKIGDLVTINHESWSELAGMVGIVLRVDPLACIIHFSYLNKALCIGTFFFRYMEVINEGR